MQNNTKLAALFLLVFLLHLAVIFGLQVFNPFASITNDSADYQEYQEQAQIIAQRLSEGNFSIKDLGTDHYYPVVVGYLHFMFNGSPILLGQLLNAIISGISAILLFMIMRRLGASTNASFWVSLAGCAYPTHLLISSLFHEDAMVILFILAALFWGLKALQSFTLKNVLIWYILVIVAAEFSSFMGVLLGIAFFVSYIFLYPAAKEEKIKNSIRIGLLVFFVSFIAELIARVSGFMAHGHSLEWIFQVGYPGNFDYHYQPNFHNFAGWFFNGWYSGVLPIMYSSLRVFLGPFPTSIKELSYLAETLPWLCILPFVFKGIIKARQNSKQSLFLVVFSVISLLLIALYAEFRESEVIMRLRIPAILSLLVFAGLGVREKITFNFQNFKKYII